jgi:hypothetical protein
LALTLIHLVSIPVTNTSVNPARSTGPALFAGGEYIAQLWLFWVVPLAFKTWAVEHNYPETDSEMALAHKIGDPVRNIYARFAQKIEPRRLMMQDFADYCDRTEPLPSAVIPFKHKKGEAS